MTKLLTVSILALLLAGCLIQPASSSTQSMEVYIPLRGPNGPTNLEIMLLDRANMQIDYADRDPEVTMNVPAGRWAFIHDARHQYQGVWLWRETHFDFWVLRYDFQVMLPSVERREPIAYTLGGQAAAPAAAPQNCETWTNCTGLVASCTPCYQWTFPFMLANRGPT